MSRSLSMFALLVILGTGLAICAGEAIAIARQPVRRAQCADCHAPQSSYTSAPVHYRVTLPPSTTRSFH
jgi:hypothetical protein